MVDFDLKACYYLDKWKKEVILMKDLFTNYGSKKGDVGILRDCESIRPSVIHLPK